MNMFKKETTEQQKGESITRQEIDMLTNHIWECFLWRWITGQIVEEARRKLRKTKNDITIENYRVLWFMCQFYLVGGKNMVLLW